MGLKIVVATERMAALSKLAQRLQDTPAMRKALAQGLNEHLRKQKVDTVTTVAAQTGMPKGMVAAGAGVKPASAASLTGAVTMRGGAVLAGSKTRRSWGGKTSPGAQHGDWPSYTRKGGLMAHTFMAYGKIMRRKGKGRGPIEAVYGPVIPNEMLRKDMPNWPRAEAEAATDLARRVVRAATFALGL